MVEKPENISLITQLTRTFLSARHTARRCNVHYRSKNRSKVTDNLAAGVKVVVIETQHKWAFIMYEKSMDSSIDSGWVMKKYLGDYTK